MKTNMQEEQKLTLKDRSNLNVAIKQTVKLSKFSLRKRITVLKREWWSMNYSQMKQLLKTMYQH
jgi:hypothetical protein